MTFAALAAAPALAQAADPGASLYMTYCASCHGADGTGGGPVADLLTVPVPDLTTVAARHEGRFPLLEVIHIIDGRSGVRAHGGSMPVWGTAFSTEADDRGLYGSAAEVRGRVLALALYLESLQQ
jgi:mono/diheme cytochrome c family protein